MYVWKITFKDKELDENDEETATSREIIAKDITDAYTWAICQDKELIGIKLVSDDLLVV